MWGVVLVGSRPGEKLSGWELSGRELSSEELSLWAVVLVGNCPSGDLKFRSTHSPSSDILPPASCSPGYSLKTTPSME